MRHRRRAKYFGVKTAHRKAMFRNMVTSLFMHGRITTTVTRAKELRRVADKLISLAKEGSLHSRRQALSFIMDKGVVGKLFAEIGPGMAARRGGYTRIVRIGPRTGDGAMMCIIELVTESLQVSKPGRKKEVAEQVAPTIIPEVAAEGQEPEAEGSSVSEPESQGQASAEDILDSMAEAVEAGPDETPLTNNKDGEGASDGNVTPVEEMEEGTLKDGSTEEPPAPDESSAASESASKGEEEDKNSHEEGK